MATVPIFAPDGTLGDIPETQLLAAVRAGAKPGVNILAPDGKPGVVPSDRAGDAVRAGGKMVPFSEQPHLGVLSQAVSAVGADLKSLAKGLPQAVANAVLPEAQMLPDSVREKVGLGPAWNPALAAQHSAEQKKAGYSLPYRAATPIAEGVVGLNVSDMEQAAREGDVGGVLGHAATPGLVMAATAGAGKGLAAAGDVSLHPAYQKALQVVKPAVRSVARAASDVVDPDITGVLSPRLAHGQRVLGRLANALEDKPQTGGAPVERDATRQNVPYAGEEKPPLVDMTEKLATEIAAKRNAPQFTADDRARAKSLLKDALASSTGDVIDQAVPGKNGAIKAEVDFYLKKGDVGGAEAALDRAAKKANPAWTPLERQPVPSTNQIRARINADAKIPAANSPADIQDTRAIQQEMNWNLQRHGWAAESEARREFIARNSTGATKGGLTEAFQQDQRAADLAQTAGAHPDLDAQAQAQAKAEKDAGTLPQGVSYVQRAQQLKDQLIASSKEAPSATQATTQSRRARVRPAVSQPVQPGAEAAPGAATSIRVPGEERRYAATYQVRELADVQPSHNGVTFNENPRYKLVNDRDYSNAVNQGKVIDASTPGKFDPAYQITDNPDATNGPIVIDSEGHALGGNGRAMILQRTYRFNPQGADAYKQMLLSKAQQFGLDPARIESMKQPVLVRQIDDLEFAKPEAKQNAVTDFNKKGTAELTPSERAIADSGRISQATLDDISSRLEDQGNQATLADILRGKSGQQVLERLINDGVLAPQERAAFVGESGLTDAGKDRISSLMIGRFFRDAAQIDSTPITLRNKLEKIAAPMAKLDRVPEWDLIPHVQQAIDLLEEARTHGAKIDDLLSQRGLFGESKYSPQAAALAKLLQGESGNALVKAVRQYAQDAADAHRPLLLGEKISPDQAFREAFAPAAGGEEDLTGPLQKSLEIARASKGLEGEQSRPFARPESSKNYGSENRLVTEEEAKQARASLRSNLFRSHAGLDPTLLADAVKLGAYHFEAGAREFAAWSQKMTQELSQAIKPHLEEIWKTITAGDLWGDTPVPTFYSKAERIALEKVPNAAPGDSILATLKNAGVKADELKWLGLDDLAGATKVTKQELLARIRDNGIQLEETTLGRPTAQQQKAIDQALAKRDQAEQAFRRLAATEIEKKLSDALAGHTPERAVESAKILADEIMTSNRSSAEILYDRFRERRPLDTILRQEFGTTWGDATKAQQQQAIDVQAKEIEARGPSDQLLEAGRDLFNYTADFRQAFKENRNSTKFDQYTLPGAKENYTELLMRLPEDRQAASTAQAARVAELQKRANSLRAQLTAATHVPELLVEEGPDSWIARDAQGLQWGEVGKGTVSSRAEAERYLNRYIHERERTGQGNQELERQLANTRTQLDLASREAHSPNSFVHPAHFKEPNILAHVRFDDRVALDGKKTLFIEEVQSDWHQKGKKEGYANSTKGWTAQLLSEPDAGFTHWQVNDADGNRVTNIVGGSAESAIRKAAERGVPDAPFKSDWHELAMKRMLRFAAENGYDRVAWSTGEQQAERYSLRKQVDRIDYFPREKSLIAYQDGQRIIEKRVEPDKLADFIGKEPASKLLAKENASPNGNMYSLQDEDLEIGGDWAKNFYDRAIPNFLNKYGKKWGARVGETELAKGNYNYGDPVVRYVRPDSAQHAGEWEVEHHTEDGRQHLDYFNSAEAAKAYARDRARGTKVHSIDVTPAMKHSVLKEGQPIAKANQPLRNLEPALA